MDLQDEEETPEIFNAEEAEKSLEHCKDLARMLSDGNENIETTLARIDEANRKNKARKRSSITSSQETMTGSFKVVQDYLRIRKIKLVIKYDQKVNAGKQPRCR